MLLEAIFVKLEDVHRSALVGEGRRFLNSVVVLLGKEVLFLASVGVNSVRLSNTNLSDHLAVAKTRHGHRTS